MRVSQIAVLRARALFGVGFTILGAVMVWRVAIAPAPLSGKLIGGLLGLALLALGVTRVAQFVRWRRGSGP
ncbi:MAG: hypothetical protein ABSD03_13265 [Vulcanimicrobiaceae bacterium]|jgi:hypothetical protein